MASTTRNTITRRKTRTINVGNVFLGSAHPILVQSMATEKTEAVPTVLKQLQALEQAGCDLVRVAANTEAAAGAIGTLRNNISIPLIADVHFDYRLAITSLRQGADCVRFNPGNIGHPDRVLEIVRVAQGEGKSLRIGVNAGSLEKPLLRKYGHPTPEALVESALGAIALVESTGFRNFKVSLKSSDVVSNLRSYSLLAPQTDVPFHVGVTEAGTKTYGTIKSSVGIGSLLLAGIGDTIRVSLSCDPLEEVRVARALLRCLHLRKDSPEVIACPSCARADINVFELAEEVERRVSGLRKNLKIAVMGCVVNGPGESAEADIGIAGGRGEGLLYKKGKPVKKIPEDKMVETLLSEIEHMEPSESHEVTENG